MVVIKKYSNRRLYDTADSRYITLEELAQKIERGTDVRVVDAASGEDLTQTTLAQIILESRGAAKLLPVGLLTQLIRMRDESLAEFLGRYLSGALDLYLQAKDAAQTIAPYNPFATLPFAATSALARMFSGAGAWHEPPPPPPRPAEPPRESSREADDVAALRREVEELKEVMRGKRKK
jgi:polyhydroxyalkanoate synthesis repressor PhaR